MQEEAREGSRVPPDRAREMAGQPRGAADGTIRAAAPCAPCPSRQSGRACSKACRNCAASRIRCGLSSRLAAATPARVEVLTLSTWSG